MKKLIATIQKTSTEGKSSLIIDIYIPSNMPLVWVEMDTPIANYIAALIRVDQAKDALGESGT